MFIIRYIIDQVNHQGKTFKFEFNLAIDYRCVYGDKEI